MTPRKKECLTCQGCPLESAGTDFAQSEGSGRLRVMICGEANGENEARDQLPFRPYAKAGSVLERTLRRIGLAREDFVISNLLRCRPFGNVLDGANYEFEAVEHCRPNFLEILRRYKPKVILAMGNLPIKHLTGMSGEHRGVGHLRGYVLRALEVYEQAAERDHDSDPLLVIPTYHPAFLRRGAIHLTGVLARDIARAVNVAAGRDQQFILDLPDLTYYKGDQLGSWAEEKDRENAARARENLTCWLRRHSLRYQLHPTRREIDLFCRDVKARSDAWLALSPDERERSYLCLSHDVESYESTSLDEDAADGFTDTQLRLSQFSIDIDQGIALQWDQDGIAATRWLLKLPLPKCGQNYTLFDLKVMQAVGERDFGDRSYFWPNGPVHDTLSMFHRFQPELPAHLQFAASFAGWKFPWKHLSGECLPLYGCIDAAAALKVYQTVRRTMEDRGMWLDPVPGRGVTGYVEQVERFRPILAAMEDRGFPVDDEKRQGLDVKFEQAEREARAELDQKFPDEARKIHPKGGYKTVPVGLKEVLERVIAAPELPLPALGPGGKPLTKAQREKAERAGKLARWQAITESELTLIRAERFQEPPTKGDDGEEEEGERYFYDLRPFPAGSGSADRRWCRVYEFSPNSSKQLLTYMEVRRHRIPQDKSGKKTTGKKELERLSAKYKDDFYLKVIECREIGKMRGTYINGFRPRADGRVHTTFADSTATTQLAAKNPNIVNVPKHGRLAKPIRAMFRDACTGKWLVEWDKKSYHVMTTGWCARDMDYMRMARLDMHSFVTWHFLRLPKADQLIGLPDDELREQLEWLKSDEKRKWTRDYQVKRAVLGIGFSMGVNKLYDMNREYFDSLAQAKRLRDMLEGLFPKVFRWQQGIRELAHRQGYLKNDFGAMRWFYEVMAPDGRGGMKQGEQAEEAVAFLPASLAFGDMRGLMKEVARRGLDEKWEQVNTVHDSLVYLVEPSRLEEHCREMYPVLTAPSKVLVDPELAPGGLVVDVDANAGPDWAEMTEVDLKR